MFFRFLQSQQTFIVSLLSICIWQLHIILCGCAHREHYRMPNCANRQQEIKAKKRIVFLVVLYVVCTSFVYGPEPNLPCVYKSCIFEAEKQRSTKSLLHKCNRRKRFLFRTSEKTSASKSQNITSHTGLFEI